MTTGLFIDMIAQHDGLAEELKDMTTPHTAEALAERLENAYNLEAIADKAAAMLRVQAQEIERLTNQVQIEVRVHEKKHAEIERLQMALRSAIYLINEDKLTCHHLHHSTKDFHEWDEPCGVEAIAKQRLESIRAALEETK